MYACQSSLPNSRSFSQLMGNISHIYALPPLSSPFVYLPFICYFLGRSADRSDRAIKTDRAADGFYHGKTSPFQFKNVPDWSGVIPSIISTIPAQDSSISTRLRQSVSVVLMNPGSNARVMTGMLARLKTRSSVLTCWFAAVFAIR